eukprot:906729-Pleurochrysis_carterae.AAC.1
MAFVVSSCTKTARNHLTAQSQVLLTCRDNEVEVSARCVSEHLLLRGGRHAVEGPDVHAVQ